MFFNINVFYVNLHQFDVFVNLAVLCSDICRITESSLYSTRSLCLEAVRSAL